MRASNSPDTTPDDPYIAVAHAEKGMIHYHQGRYGVALEDAETAIRVYGDVARTPMGVAAFGANESVGAQSLSAWTL